MRFTSKKAGFVLILLQVTKNRVEHIRKPHNNQFMKPYNSHFKEPCNEYLLLLSDPGPFIATLLPPHMAILRLLESPTHALDTHA